MTAYWVSVRVGRRSVVSGLVAFDPTSRKGGETWPGFKAKCLDPWSGVGRCRPTSLPQDDSVQGECPSWPTLRRFGLGCLQFPRLAKAARRGAPGLQFPRLAKAARRGAPGPMHREVTECRQGAADSSRIVSAMVYEQACRHQQWLSFPILMFLVPVWHAACP